MPDANTDKELQTVNLPGIEIFAEGTWNGDKYDSGDLDAIVQAFGKVGFEPTAKIGHAGGQEALDEKEYRKIFGAPALGYVSRVYRQGKKLLADFKQVPRNFANLIKAGSYKRVSSEIYWNYKDESSGKSYPRVLKSVAFLGAEIPAVTSLKDVEALFKRNDNGCLYAYDGEREFRVYAMEKPMGKCTVKKMEDGKYAVIGPDGKQCSSHDSEEDATKKANELNQAAMKYEDYPWEKCVADQIAKGEDEESAKKICGSIRAKNNDDRKGEVHMTEQEVQAKLDLMKAELIKDYAAKSDEAIAKAKADAKAEVTAAFETEKKEMADRIASLEKQNQDASDRARKATIEGRMDKLRTAGKISPVEAKMLTAVFEFLPDTGVHKYANDKGEEVSELASETLWKVFENRSGKLFRELSAIGSETKSYDSASEQVKVKAEELVASKKISMFAAYKQVAKSDPELWAQHEAEVKGAH